MSQSIVEDQVVLAAEVADEGHVGGMAADADHGVLGVLPVRDLLLQVLMDLLLAGQEAAAAGAGAVLVDGGLGGVLDFLPAAHAHIVVAAELQDFLAVDDAGIQEGGLMGDEIGIVALADEGFLALEEVAVFRGILKAGNGPDGHALFGL